MTDHDLTVVDDADSSRFTLLLDGEPVGLADYSLGGPDGTVVTIPHVETDPAHRGKGFAATLMDGIVDAVRTDGRTILPLCPYAATYMRDRPATHDLLVS